MDIREAAGMPALIRAGSCSTTLSPVAADWPELLAIVEQRKVKPAREALNRQVHRERWWRYGETSVTKVVCRHPLARSGARDFENQPTPDLYFRAVRIGFRRMTPHRGSIPDLCGLLRTNSVGPTRSGSDSSVRR